MRKILQKIAIYTISSIVFPVTIFAQVMPGNVVNNTYNPVINRNIYNQINGYSSPNKYVFKNNRQIFDNNGIISKDFGTEYYLSLGGGVNKSMGSGLKGEAENIPLNDDPEPISASKSFIAGFGVMNNRKYGIEVNYTHLMGLRYGDVSNSSGQFCGPSEDEFINDCDDENDVSGGDIKSSSLTLNYYMPFSDLVQGTLMEGIAYPYLTAGIGMAFNSISDYEVFDEYANGEEPKDNSGEPFNGNESLSGKYDKDGTISHFGAMTSGLAYTFGGGFTFTIDKKTMLDLYAKYSKYGVVASKDKVYYSYDQIDILAPTSTKNEGVYNGIRYEDYCTSNAINEGFEYNEETKWCERKSGKNEGFEENAAEVGDITNAEFGVKLRLVF